MQRGYQRLQPEDIQHVLIHKFSVKVKVIFCVRHGSIVGTGGTIPLILILATDGASGRLHSLAVLPRFNYPMETTEPKSVYTLDDSLKAINFDSTFVKSDHLK